MQLQQSISCRTTLQGVTAKPITVAATTRAWGWGALSPGARLCRAAAQREKRPPQCCRQANGTKMVFAPAGSRVRGQRMQKPGQKEGKLDKQVTMTQMAGRQGGGALGLKNPGWHPEELQQERQVLSRTPSGLKCQSCASWRSQASDRACPTAETYRRD